MAGQRELLLAMATVMEPTLARGGESDNLGDEDREDRDGIEGRCDVYGEEKCIDSSGSKC